MSSTTFRSSGRARRRTGCPTCSSAAADAMGRSAPAAAGRCGRQTNPRPSSPRPTSPRPCPTKSPPPCALPASHVPPRSAPPRLTALRAHTRQAKVSQDASGDSLLDGLLDELKADPMGISAPARKRTFAGAMAHRAALPSYRPDQGGSTYSAPPPSNDDYTRPVPRVSINDLCEEADDVEAPGFGGESEAQVLSGWGVRSQVQPTRGPRGRGRPRVWVGDRIRCSRMAAPVQFAEDEPPPQPDAPPMARAERGAAAATSAAEPLEEDEAQSTVVPFVQPVEQRGGLDWFQVCEPDLALTLTLTLTPRPTSGPEPGPEPEPGVRDGPGGRGGAARRAACHGRQGRRARAGGGRLAAHRTLSPYPYPYPYPHPLSLPPPLPLNPNPDPKPSP